MPEEKVIITERYLLISPIPFYQDAVGDIWLDELWHQDLLAHLEYLEDLQVVAPILQLSGPGNFKRVDVPANRKLRFIPLPHIETRLSALFSLPKTLYRISRAVFSADIVHSGVVGWPYPYGIIANPLAVLTRKPLIIVIESSPWRIAKGNQAKNIRRIFQSFTIEAFARWSARNASLSIFTSTSYKEAFSTNDDKKAYVAPATWINESDIVDKDVASEKLSKESVRPRFLFAGRMTIEKGVLTLLDALLALDQKEIEIEFDFIGNGELLDNCRKAAKKFKHIRSNILDPVSYGKDFFNLIRKYDGLVVPSLSDEQPRIIFDAYSQAVPIIASDTSGNRDFVMDGKTGFLFPVGDSLALSEILSEIVNNRTKFEKAGMNGHLMAFKYTHANMHRERAKKIRAILSDV